MSTDFDILYMGFLLGHGGDAVQMLDLASGMVARGRRVKILVPELETSVRFAELCKEKGLPIERTPWMHADAHNAKQNPFDLFRLFLTHRAPILHLHTGDVCPPRSALLMMRLLALPRAFATVHSPYNTLTPGDSRSRTWASLAPRVFHRVICPSEHSRRTQLSYGVPASSVCTVHNGVNIARYGQGDPMVARQMLNLSADTPLVVFTSRLEEQKRPHDALEAFLRVSTEFPEAHMVFVGRGVMEGALRATAEQNGLGNRVHFPGFQTNIPDWLASATVWFLPTESENFSLAILEALAAGCPVLSTLCQGNDEVLENESNALATAVGDVEAQTQGLRRLLREPALRQKLSEAARQTARRYSVERMIDGYVRCYAVADARYAELVSSPDSTGKG